MTPSKVIPVKIVGGHHDGLEGAVSLEVIVDGFLVEIDDGYVYGYQLDHRDRNGVYIFVPNGSQQEAGR